MSQKIKDRNATAYTNALIAKLRSSSQSPTSACSVRRGLQLVLTEGVAGGVKSNTIPTDHRTKVEEKL